jgi:hypothetical protein
MPSRQRLRRDGPRAARAPCLGYRACDRDPRSREAARRATGRKPTRACSSGGRRWLIAISVIPYNTGVLGILAKAVLVLVALRRCQRALFRNERYRFSTLRWGVPILALVALGELMKVLA